MKRIKMIVIMCIWFIFRITAGFGEDSIPGIWSHNAYDSITYAPEGYYSIVDSFMYYYDPDTFSPLLLCSRLNCLHWQEENLAECDAFVSGFIYSKYFDQHLYYEDIDENGLCICLMNPDGTAHEKWISAIMPEAKQWIPYGFQDKYYFFIPMEMEPGDELMINTRCRLCALDLSRPSDKPIIVEEWTGFTGNSLMLLEVLDGKLYYMSGTYEGDKKLWLFDLEKRQKSELLSFQVPAYHYVADSVIYVLQPNTGVFRIRAGSAEKETLILKDEDDMRGTEYYWDNRYIYGVTSYEDQLLCDVDIWDLEGNHIIREKIPGEKITMITEEHLFFKTEFDDKPGLVVGLDSLLQGNPIVYDFIYPERINP